MMVFAAGVLVGCVIGLGAGALLQRRDGGPNLIAGRGVPTAVAMVALVVSAIALARSGDHDHTVAAPPDTSTATTAPATPTSTAGTQIPDGVTASSTTSTTPAAGLVSVPNVEHLARVDAQQILQSAGFKVSTESLSVAANVPVGYVLSQAPLPAAMAPAGSTVTLVISAAA